MVREEGTQCPWRDILGFIESFRAIESSGQKVRSVECLSVCVCACVYGSVPCTQMHCMTLISLMLALLAVMPCGSEVAYKVMT